MADLPKRKVGIVSCSGEELPEGTITRLAALKVLEQLRPAETVTICLPLFLAGGQGDRAFARFYPTIAVDGCELRCASRATERYSSKPAASLMVRDLIAQNGLGQPEGRRRLNPAGLQAVDMTADRMAVVVDELLSKGWDRRAGAPLEAHAASASPESEEETDKVATCSCGSGIPVQEVRNRRPGGHSDRPAAHLRAVPGTRQAAFECDRWRAAGGGEDLQPGARGQGRPVSGRPSPGIRSVLSEGACPMSQTAVYHTTVSWKGEHWGHIVLGNGPEMDFSAPPDAQGHPGVLTPEDAFVAAANTCIMMMFIWAAERYKLHLLSYACRAEGTKRIELDRTEIFTQLYFRPTIRVSAAQEAPERVRGRIERALQSARRYSLVANSVKSQIVIEPEIEVLA